MKNLTFRQFFASSVVAASTVIVSMHALPLSAIAQTPVSDSASLVRSPLVRHDEPKHSRSAYGIAGGFARELYSSDFKYLPGYPGCSVPFTSGGGFDRSLSLYYSYHAGDRTTFFLQGGYNVVSSNMLAREKTWINLDGVATPATIEHHVDATLNRVTFGPAFGYELRPGFSLTLAGTIGLLVSPTFSMQEKLVDPPDRGVFVENGLRTRNEHSGALPDANTVQSSIEAGARYELPLNLQRTLSLVPAATFRLGATNLVQNLSWKENGARATLSVEYRPLEQEEPAPAPEVKPQPQPKPDTTVVLPRIFASIAASGVTKGVEENAAVLRVEEVYETRLVPIVPFVFFDENSSDLPARYKSTRAEYSAATLAHAATLDVYHDVLNVLGERLTNDAKARVTLTGCTDGVAERDIALAQARAQRVKQYLTSEWHVQPERIAIRTRTTPEHPSPTQIADGLAENRRVEIATSDASLLAPLLTSDTVREANPPIIRFRANAGLDSLRALAELATSDKLHVKHMPPDALRSWRIEASQEGQLLKQYTGDAPVPQTVDWTLGDDQRSIPRAPGTLHYAIEVRDAVGQTTTAAGDLSVEQRTLRTKRREIADNAEIERYTLLLFDFNSSDLGVSNSDLLRMIKSRIRKGSTVTISGYGDRIGDVQANRTLADERAHNAAHALGLPDTSVAPADGRTYPYDNNSPEGRFYSRTVEITIRTPLESSN